jgi:glutaredoxin/glutathione-dependent peroxiredoxin
LKIHITHSPRRRLSGMPGAFTPTCTGEHLPGFIENSSRLDKLGVDQIIVLTTNDRYVNEQWGNTFKVLGNKLFKFVSDGDGDFVRSLGLAADMGFGVGIRSKRFALVVENGKVTNIQVDEGMDNCSTTSAKNVIEMITPPPSELEEGESEMSRLVLIGGGALAAAVLTFMLASGGGGGAPQSTTKVSKSYLPPIEKVVNSKQRFSLLEEFK